MVAASSSEYVIVVFFAIVLPTITAATLASIGGRNLLQSNNSPPQQTNIETTFPSNSMPAFTTPPAPSPSPVFAPEPSYSLPACPHNKTSVVAPVVGTAFASFVISSLLFFGFFKLTGRKENINEIITNIDNDHNNHVIGGDGTGHNALPQQQPQPPPTPLLVSVYSSNPPPSQPPPPPPPSVSAAPAAPPPPPPPPAPATASPPPPPPRPPKAGPPPPQPSGKGPAMPPPPPPRGKPANPRPPLGPMGDGGAPNKAQPKLKPFNWDKTIAANVKHSTVWKDMSEGSFKIDDDAITDLFGTKAAGQSSTGQPKAGASSKPSVAAVAPQIVLLDARKSQNIAIVIKSIAISREKITNSLHDGHGDGIGSDALEKLSKVAPTKEEMSQILQYSGDPSKLADAESFLFHVLKAVPSPFERVDAMLFKANYEGEVLHVKNSLEMLEAACKELRGSAVFRKLLEAILKAGNRLNAGTARGNAKAFNLESLRKLTDVKSTDGKTTLLNFVVEEVIRLEGKRSLLNNRNTSSGTTTTTTTKDEKEREYITLGVPVMRGLSEELANVKKSALIDYDVLMASHVSISARTKKIMNFLRTMPNTNDGFSKEMREFIATVEVELKTLEIEKERVMELVKRTTEYYQVGASKQKNSPPLQLFVIVKDFLGMVDQVCVYVISNMEQQEQKRKRLEQIAARDHEKKNKSNIDDDNKRGDALSKTEPPQSSLARRRSEIRFPNLPAHFLSKRSMGSSGSGSDSDDDFD